MKHRGVQTSLFYPAVHEFTAYRERYGLPSLPRSEHIARAEITLPLFAEHGRVRAGPCRRHLGGGAGVTWTVPLTDVQMTDDDLAAVADCLRSGWLTMGPRTQAFEAAVADWTGMHRTPSPCPPGPPRCTWPAPRSGSVPGDEVIVPALTFVATANARALRRGDPGAGRRRRRRPRRTWTRPTSSGGSRRARKAVIAVHMWGYPADLAALRELCDAHGLHLIEDAAQALGARTDGAGVRGRAASRSSPRSSCASARAGWC